MASYGLPYLSQISINRMGYKQSSVMSVCYPILDIEYILIQIIAITIFDNTEF
jgi:hypothetical protein